MATYIPNSTLLNHVYIPFVQPAKLQIFTVANDFPDLETGPNGFPSVINFNKTNANNSVEEIFPFIDLSKFDSETKDWFWYDDIGFPYRIIRDSTGLAWELIPIWDFGKYIGSTITFTPETPLKREEGGNNLGFYSPSTIDTETVNMYTGSPIILTINGEVVKDRTIYGQTNANFNLTDLGVEDNKEFYYNSALNRIYTNQNLNEFDSAQIKIYCYTVSQEVSIKCRMKANQGKDAYVTPTVDYYIAKLDGQFLRG